MVKTRQMVHKMHACSQKDKQDGGHDGFFAGHNDQSWAKLTKKFCNWVAIVQGFPKQVGIMKKNVYL